MPADATAAPGAGAARRFRYPLFIARRFVGRRLISVLSALGFVVGVMSLILALALMTGFQEDVIGRILGSNASILVRPADGGPTLADPDAVVRTVEALPGVVAAEPVVHGYAGLVGPSRLLQWTAVSGVDPARGGRVTDIAGAMVFGSIADLGRPTRSGRPGVVLGAELARRSGLVPGDTVQLLVPRPKLTPWGVAVRQPHFEVVGTFSTGFNEYDEQWSFLALPVAQQLFDAEGGASWVAVRVRDIHRLAEGVEEIRGALGGRYAVMDVLSANRTFFSALRLEKLMMFLAIGLIVLVAALGVVTTLVLTVTQKVRQIGVLVAMGATPRGVLQIFVIQGLAMGVLGTLLGAGLGVGLSYVLDRFRLIKLDPEIYYLDHLPFAVRAGDLGTIVGVAIVVAALATLYPAWRAARLDPVEALRRD